MRQPAAAERGQRSSSSSSSTVWQWRLTAPDVTIFYTLVFKSLRTPRVPREAARPCPTPHKALLPTGGSVLLEVLQVDTAKRYGGRRSQLTLAPYALHRSAVVAPPARPHPCCACACPLNVLRCEAAATCHAAAT